MLYGKLEQIDRPGAGSSGELAGAAPPSHQQLGASLAADAALQRQLVALTPEALGEAALEEARSIIATCRLKLAESAAEAAAAEAAPAEPTAAPSSQAADGEQAAAAAGAKAGAEAGPSPSAAAATQDYWSSSEGHRLGALIEGCVRSLVLLQRGAAGGTVPAAGLATALDGALAAVRPQAASNQRLYAEIEEAMRGLKVQLQLSAAS